MIIFLNFLIGALWLTRIVVNVLSYINLWWVKEYRFDRMLIHLRTAQGRRILFPAFRRPPVTPKTVGLVVFTGLSLAGLFYVLSLPVWTRFVMVDLVTFPLTGVWVGLFKLPTFVYHQIIITKAVRKLRAHRPMLVIGITGSYGKTSTKEYLTAILSSRYRVLATEASQNSPIGIAEVVIKKLQPDHQILVVEMGAYKRGEIARMSQMVRPEVGIITAINPQHQDLFLSLANTKLAKYELITGLRGRQIAIFNADNPHTRQMGEWAKRDGRRVWWWSAKAVQSEKLFRAKDIQADFRGVSFICVSGRETAAVKAKVLGEHQVSNILAAIAGAVAGGMNFKEAARAASRVKPVKKVMELNRGINGAQFINDTFNNNPDAAIAALAFLAKSRGKKIVVFQPMIELGNYSNAAHEKVGEYAAQVCDAIILTNNNFYEAFKQGVQQYSLNKPTMVLSADKAADYLRREVGPGDTVLFKGKEAESVLRALGGE